MNYSGTTVFEHPIYRFDDFGNEKEIIVTVTGRSYFQSGSFGSLPENSYPDECDTEIMSVVDDHKNDWHSQLSKNEKEELLDMISNSVIDNCDDCEYECDDYI